MSCKDFIDDARENYYDLGHDFARKNGKIKKFKILKWKGWTPILQVTTLLHCLLAFFERTPPEDLQNLREIGDELGPSEVSLWTVIINGIIIIIYSSYSIVCIMFYSYSFFMWTNIQDSFPIFPPRINMTQMSHILYESYD